MRSASVSVAGASHTNLAHNPLYIDVFSDVKHVYTAGDIVHGIVRVDPTARPLNVSIVFKGISILYDKDLEGCKTEFFRLEQELFTSSGTGENYDILRQGTAEDGRVDRHLHQAANGTIPKTLMAILGSSTRQVFRYLRAVPR
jgi:hypothetical protein